MNKSFVVGFVMVILITIGVWYVFMGKSASLTRESPTPQTIQVEKTPYSYSDDIVGFTVASPIAFFSSTHPNFYHVNPAYIYVLSTSTSIPGVQFSVPHDIATGTNLSPDSYVSVEHRTQNVICEASAFIGTVQPGSVIENNVTYSFASSSEAAAGNRYEEYVYALPDSNPCVAVRYFIHYGVIENYEPGTIRAFDRAQLFDEFDAIRKSLIYTHK
jgi:hypothetical protein